MEQKNIVTSLRGYLKRESISQMVFKVCIVA